MSDEETGRDVPEGMSQFRKIIADLRVDNERLKAENAELRQKVTTDPLTGLKNRALCELLLNAYLELAKRGGRKVAIAFIDIDNYGIFNKKYGQLTGDEVLIKLTEAVKKRLRTSDTFGRFGGEEFLIILPEADAISAYRTIERLRTELEGEFSVDIDGIVEKITLSIGIASSEDSCDYARLVQMANDAERAAKDDGKARAYLNICGAILNAEEVERLSNSPDMLAIIGRYRAGRLEITRDGQIVPFAHFLKTARALSQGSADGDFTVRTTGGDSGPAFAAYLRAPDEDVRTPVRDTVDQLLHGLRRASLSAFPSAELWLGDESELNFLNALVTHACPMNCVYCTQEHEAESGLTLETWKRAIDEATDNGERRGVILSITGGEPLVKRALVLELLAYAQSRGMYTTMNTNAMLLDPTLSQKTADMAQALLATGIRSLNISLDSAIPAMEDRITQTERAFGRVISGLKAIAAHRDGSALKRVTINHVLTRENFNTFIQFVEWMAAIRKNEDVRLFDDINPLPVKEAPDLYLRIEDMEHFNVHIVPRIVYIARREGLALLGAKAQKIFAADVAKDDERMQRIYLASGGRYFGFNEMFMPCATAMTSATILPDGRVFPCTYHREAREGSEGRLVLGNINDGTMREMRKEYFDVLRRLPKGPNGGLNPICERLCGPDLKGINKGVLAGLRRAGVAVRL